MPNGLDDLAARRQARSGGRQIPPGRHKPLPAVINTPGAQSDAGRQLEDQIDRQRQPSPRSVASRRLEPGGKAAKTTRRPVTLWVSGDLNRSLRAQAGSTGLSRTRLFLAAYEAGFDRVEAVRPSTSTRSGLPAREDRRQVPDAQQLTLYLTVGELAVIDTQAAKLGMSRSALVEAVLQVGGEEEETRP